MDPAQTPCLPVLSWLLTHPSHSLDPPPGGICVLGTGKSAGDPLPPKGL